MFINYIKLAWRVLSRRKFFTFITLFGISFTLMILMIVTSFLQAEFGGRAPLGNQEELIMMTNIKLEKKFYDTIPVLDTTFVDGIAKYDTTYDIKSAGSSSSSSSINHKILNDHFRDLESTKASTIFNWGASFDVFINNSKLKINTSYTDADFWSVFNFKYIEGRPFDASEVEQAARVATISDEMAEKYFGRTSQILDESITLDGKQYRIIGLYESAKLSMDPLTPDMVIPYTDFTPSFDHPYLGQYNMAFLSDDKEKSKGEIENVGQNIPLDLSPDFNEVSVNPATYKEIYANMVYNKTDASESLKIMKRILLGLLSIFILLPVLNLINLNVSRIMDRSSEIGVRKAFGATKSDILTQFVFENIIQTFLGGIIGFILAAAAIYFINSGKYLEGILLTIDLKFFMYSFIICLFFGVLSGVLPAWRMSKLQIVNALKSKQL